MAAPTLTRPTDPAGSSIGNRLVQYLILTVALYGLMAVAGTTSVWSADEGAFLYQVSALADGDGWSFSHPFPEADPAGTAYPLHLSSWAPDTVEPGRTATTCPAEGVSCGYVVFAKHIVYVWLGVVLFGVGGYGAIIALSVAGTVGAAIATSRLAGHVEPKAEVPALWLTGLGSPLFFNAFLGWAHTPAAGLVGLAAYGLHVRADSKRWLIVGATALALACLLRTEATLAGLAMSLGWLLMMARWPFADDQTVRNPRSTYGALAAAAFAATTIGTAIDRLTATPTAGAVEPPAFDEAFGLVGGRLEGFMNTWLKPGYVTRPLDLLPLVAATALIGGAILSRRNTPDQRPAVAAGVIAGALMATRFLISPVALIPGLVIAFPLLFVGIILLRKGDFQDRKLTGLVIPFALFCGAVLATQYRTGGGGEWGGRYFAIGLPLGIAASAVGLTRFAGLLNSDHRRRIGLLVATSLVLLQLMGLLGIRSIRDRTVELQNEIAAAAQDAGDGDTRPVVVTTMNGLGRWLWEDLDEMRMLRVSADDLPALGQRLRTLGVARVTLVSNQPDQDAAQLAPWFMTSQDAGEATSVVALEATVGR